MTLWRFLLSLTLLAISGPEPFLARSAEVEKPAADGEIGSAVQYVRVFVPADRLQDWARGKVRYVPVAPDEFEQLVKRAGAAGRASRASVGAAVVSARYVARLEGAALIDGEASLEVVHSADAPVMLPLDPCGLAIDEASWAGEDELLHEDARFGLGADGRFGVLVERASSPRSLEFGWSLGGRRDAEGAIHFLWEAPRCSSSRLVLDLPDSVTLKTENGIVVEEPSPQEGGRRWRIEVGAHPRFAFRVVPAEDQHQRLPATRARQSTVYDFSLKGVEVRTQLQLDVYGEPLRQITVALDPGLQIVEAFYVRARHGDTPLPWTVISPTPGSRLSKDTRAVLEFPEPVEGTGRVVRVHAMAAIQTDSRWRLPAIRPEGVFWKEGEATLLVPVPLRLEQLTPIEGRQSLKIDPLPAPKLGEKIDVQYFGPEAGVQVVLARPDAAVHLDSGTLIELGGGEVTGRIAADVSVTVGSLSRQFLLEADVARQWAIDSVEALPREVLADWNVEQEGATSKLTVQLARPLPQRLEETAPVRLSIAVRRLGSPLGRTLRIEDLVPLRFRGAREGRRLISLRAREPYELKLTGTETLTRADPSSLKALDAAALSLFAEPPRDLLFESDPGATGLRVSLVTRKPKYSATIQVEATVSDGSLIESYRLTCVPEATRRVERVLVRFSKFSEFSKTRESRLRWTLGNEEENHWTARRLPPANQAESVPAAGGETWEIRLRRPRSAPFEIRATRTTELPERAVVGLASLPEAATQRATVVVRSVGSAAVRIENRRLEPISAETVPAGQYSTARAALRYDPVAATAPTPEVVLGITRLEAETGVPSAWVWSCRLESRYEVSGRGRHLLTCRTESTGAKQLRLTLPPEATRRDVRGVWVDGEQVARRPAEDGADRVLAVDLPPGARFPVVSVGFETAGEPLGTVDSIAPSWPEIDVPVLVRHWTAWLPPGYEAHAPDLRSSPHCSAPVSWTQRLFGPLGREADRRPFDPVAVGDWSRVIRGEPDSRSAQEKAGALVRQLGARARQDRPAPSGEGLDWGRLLADTSIETLLADTMNDQPELQLLVDRHALGRLGLTPRTAVHLPEGGTHRDLGAVLLNRGHLALLVHPKAAVITSAENAALDHAQLTPVDHEKLTPLENQTLWSIRPGPLFDHVGRAAGGRTDASFVPVYVWQEQPAEPGMPWAFSRSGGFQPADTRGWTAYRLEVSSQLPGRLLVARRDAIATFRWAAFLAVIGLAWWKSVHRPAVLTIALGVFGIAAFLLPEVYAQAASGALLGTAFVLGLRLILPERERGDSATRSARRSIAAARRRATMQVVILVFVAATLVALSVAARGGEPESKPSSPRTAWLPNRGVLIPVDENRQPTGDTYQVPEALFKELDRLAGGATEASQGWLVRGATYRGTLVWQPAPERLVLGEFKATFEVEVLGSSASVRIPFGGEGPNRLADGALLDGRPAQPEWQQGALLLNVAEPGQHLLSLTLTPSLHAEDTSSGFDLTIPRLATSRLELTLPADAPVIDVPSAAGSIRQDREADPPRLEAELGPTDKLSVRWQQGGGSWQRGPAGRVPDVEELLWLKVKPGSVVLDARFRLSGVEGGVRELHLAADPRLRLRPVEGAQVHVTAGPVQSIRLVFSEPLADQGILEASFLLSEASGIGNLRLPHVEVLGAHRTKRWMAVWVDPSLEAEEAAAGLLENVGVPEFKEAWGDAPVLPRSAYNLPSGEPSWSMATQPREPHTMVDQSLALGFTPKEAQVHFDARLNTTPGYRFQYRLLAPPELEIESVSLHQGDVDRVYRWSQAADGTITLFLTRAVSGEQALSLRAHLPTPARGKLPLPTVDVEGAESQSSVIQVFREPEVQVHVSNLAGLAEAEPPLADESRAALGRLVGRFDADGTGPAKATLTLSPNRPKIRAEQITSLRSDEDLWEAEFQFRISVDGGVLDELHVVLPPTCSGPYKIDPPPGVWKEEETAAGRRLLIQPASAAITGEYRLTVSCPLAIPPGGQVSVPEVVLDGAEFEKHLLVLPTQSGLRPVGWETSGLSETKLPEDFAALPVAPEAFVVYRVDETPFQAVLQAPEEDAEVHLLDLRLAWLADATCHGVATFDLESARASECVLRLPAGWKLVQVTVAGVACAPVPAGDQRWRVPLRADLVPQRMEIVFTGSAPEPDPNGLIRFEAPSLEEFAVRQTLWTVSGPLCYELGIPEGMRTSTPLDLALARRESAEALLNRAAGPAAAGDDPAERGPLERVWVRQYAASSRELLRQLTQAGQTDSAGIIEAQLQSVAPAAGEAAPVADGPGEIWPWTLDRSHPTTCCVAGAGSDSLTLRYRRHEPDLLARRVVGAAGMAGAMLLALLAIRLGVPAALLYRWPCLVGVVAGLAWWLWLWPSALGWGIVLVSLAASLRSGWRRSRPSGSAIVSLSLSPR
ncbi:MAG: hypothetical protein ABIP48_27225 [Planctomycetota bacterium]